MEIAWLGTRAVPRDGHPVSIWLTATALVDESGRAYGVSSTERPLQREAPEEEE